MENSTTEKKTPNFLTIGSKKGRAQQLRSHEEEIINAMKSRYGLSDKQIELMKPLLDSFYQGNLTSADIETYANELIAAQQEINYNNESSVANRMRAAGLNPDLTGLSEGTAEIPGAASIANSTDTKPASSEGACKTKATQITSTLMQAATLGLNAYNILQNVMGTSIERGIAGAATDILNIDGDDNGEVTDVKGAVEKLVNSKMFRNKAERHAYIMEATKRMNAIDVATERMNRKTAKDTARLNSKVAAFKGSEEYIQKALKLLETNQTIEVLAAQYDNEIAERNAQFLADHPEYNEAQLRAEMEEANSRKAGAEARKAESEATVAEKTQDAQIQKAKAEGRAAEERAEQEESNTAVIKLRNENEKTELAFDKAVNEVITDYVETDLNTWGDWEKRKGFANKRAKFKQARRYKERKEGRRHNVSASVPGVGNVSTNF